MQTEPNTALFFCSGDRIRTCGLWVMSPTSYQLLHSAMSMPSSKAAEYKTFLQACQGLLMSTGKDKCPD